METKDYQDVLDELNIIFMTKVLLSKDYDLVFQPVLLTIKL